MQGSPQVVDDKIRVVIRETIDSIESAVLLDRVILKALHQDHDVARARPIRFGYARASVLLVDLCGNIVVPVARCAEFCFLLNA